MLTLEKNQEVLKSDAGIVQTWFVDKKIEKNSAKKSAFALQERLRMIKNKSAILNAVEMSDHVQALVK